MPAPKRAEILFKAAQLIAARKEEFARDMTREMGKVLDETRGDVQEAIDMTYFLAAEGRRLHGQTAPSELRDKFAMSIRQPIGVCSMITPWNFPMAIPSWKIIPALVCGNTVVLKPSELTPLSAINFVKVLEEAGVPRGRQPRHRRPAIGEVLTTLGMSRWFPSPESRRSKLCQPNCGAVFRRSISYVAARTRSYHGHANLELRSEGCCGDFGTSGQRCTAAPRDRAREAARSFREIFIKRAAPCGWRRTRFRHADGPSIREALTSGYDVDSQHEAHDGLRRPLLNPDACDASSIPDVFTGHARYGSRGKRSSTGGFGSMRVRVRGGRSPMTCVCLSCRLYTGLIAPSGMRESTPIF